MKVNELINALQVLEAEHGPQMEVLLDVGDAATDEHVIGDITNITAEQSHDSEEQMFVRITGGDV